MTQASRARWLADPEARRALQRILLNNAVPAFGALVLGWSLWLVVMLYWLENLVGAFFCNRLIRRHQSLTHLRGHYRRQYQFSFKRKGQGHSDFAHEHLLNVVQVTLAHGCFIGLFASASAGRFAALEPMAFREELLWILALVAVIVSGAAIDYGSERRNLGARSFAWVRQRTQLERAHTLSMHFGILLSGFAMFVYPQSMAVILIGTRLLTDAGFLFVAITRDDSLADQDDSAEWAAYKAERQAEAARDELPCPPEERDSAGRPAARHKG